MPDCRTRFPHRLSCRLTVLLEIVVEGLTVVVVVGWDVFQYLKRVEYRRSHQIHTPGVTNEDLWIIVGQCISIIGILIALLLLVTGVRVLIGPCQLTPHVTDSGTLKSAIKVCGLWCTLEFFRAILLLVGLSLRLLVFALLAADELTNLEIAKQSTVLIPLTTSLTSMSATSKFRDEVETHLCREINHMHPIPQFALPSTSGGGG